MSRHHIEKVTCPSCHHEGDFELWDSINTALDPEMKEKVLNQSIFLYTCPSCGETFRLNYSTLYHQMEDLVMIYLVPESEVKKTYEIFYEKNALADYRTEKYLYRIVTSANQLVEKIQIFDAGKDDRVMELVKLLATDSILKNDPDIEFDELRFAVDDDGTNILVIINKGEIRCNTILLFHFSCFSLIRYFANPDFPLCFFCQILHRTRIQKSTFMHNCKLIAGGS